MGGMITGLGKIGLGIAAGNDATNAAWNQFEAESQAADVGELQSKEKANFEAGRLRMLGSQLVERQHLAYVSQGVDPTEGSAANVMADTRLMSEHDALMVENNAAREVRGYRLQKDQAKQKYETARSTASNNTAGSVLGGASDMIGSALSFGLK